MVQILNKVLLEKLHTFSVAQKSSKIDCNFFRKIISDDMALCMTQSAIFFFDLRHSFFMIQKTLNVNRSDL